MRLYRISIPPLNNRHMFFVAEGKMHAKLMYSTLPELKRAPGFREMKDLICGEVALPHVPLDSAGIVRFNNGSIMVAYGPGDSKNSTVINYGCPVWTYVGVQ